MSAVTHSALSLIVVILKYPGNLFIIEKELLMIRATKVVRLIYLAAYNAYYYNNNFTGPI